MSNKYASVFDSIHNYVKGSPLAGYVLLASIFLFLIGCNNFLEDTYSSYIGVQMIEETFNVRPASWEVTYWAISVFFQLITIIAFFAYLSDRQGNWWALWVTIGSQVIDFGADVWYRGYGTFTFATLVVSIFMTGILFTAGSELALTFGFGLTSKLFVEGMLQLSITTRNILNGFGKFMKMMASGRVDGDGSIDSSVSHQIQERRFEGYPKQDPRMATVYRPPNAHNVSVEIDEDNSPQLPPALLMQRAIQQKQNQNGGQNNSKPPFRGNNRTKR